MTLSFIKKNVMTIKVNGENKNITSTTIADLLQKLKINPRGMLVHVNGILVHWTKYDSFQIHDHDDIGIIRVVGGG